MIHVLGSLRFRVTIRDPYHHLFCVRNGSPPRSRLVLVLTPLVVSDDTPVDWVRRRFRSRLDFSPPSPLVLTGLSLDPSLLRGTVPESGTISPLTSEFPVSHPRPYLSVPPGNSNTFPCPEDGTVRLVSTTTGLNHVFVHPCPSSFPLRSLHLHPLNSAGLPLS